MHGTSSVMFTLLPDKQKIFLEISRKTFFALEYFSDSTHKQNRPALEGVAVVMLMMTGSQIHVSHIALDFTVFCLDVKRIVPKYWTIAKNAEIGSGYN